MVEVEIFRNGWYGWGKEETGEVIVFADIEEESVKKAHVIVKTMNMMQGMRKDSCTLHVQIYSSENLSEWVQNLWGYVPKERKMLIFGCVEIKNTEDGWYLAYRIVSILHVHKKSNIMLKARMANIEKNISKYPILSCIKDVNRHLAEGGRKTMVDLVNYDHEFMIDLNEVHIEAYDLKKISEAWANGYYIYWKAEVFSKSYMNLVVRATRLTQSNIDAKEIENWKKIEPILKKQEIPDEWVYEVVEIIKRNVM